MEQSTPENEAIVARVYEEALRFDGNLSKMTETQRVVYLVEHFMQEVNSGASFEQYFRWASIEELHSILPTLKGLALEVVASMLEQAMSIAFPEGIPKTESEKDDLTEWSEDQEEALGALFEPLEDLNGRVMNVLGEFASGYGA